jgi:uncharacterized protein with PQ loop repeat
MGTDVVGWASALVLGMTLSWQVYTQWKSKTCAGVSRWLFVGQLVASAGFVVYSYLLENRVFVMTNAFNFCAALIGQGIYLKNKKNDARMQATGAAR